MHYFRTRTALTLCVGLLIAAITAQSGAADGFKLYENGASFLKFTGRIQAQYHSLDAHPGAQDDDLFFRRVTPTLEAGIGADWQARLQVELMSSTGIRDTKIKDAYAQYKGISGIKLNIGNAAFPFSREYLTSAERQQFVERTLTGSRSYGVPYRNLGLHLLGECNDSHITYGFSAARATIDPDAGKIIFDSPINSSNGMNQGWIAGARAEFHPYGKLAYAQGDFDGKTKATLGVAAYTWNNTGNNIHTDATGTSTSSKTNDVDQVQAVELSGAVRYHGWSADSEFNRIEADAVDRGFSSGLYRNGHAVLRTFMVKGGYMVIADKLELTAGYQTADADTYAKTQTGQLIGANWFFNQHDLKLQTTFQRSENLKGVAGTAQNELFAQLQYVF